jgi:HlyD family secretion protein
LQARLNSPRIKRLVAVIARVRPRLEGMVQHIGSLPSAKRFFGGVLELGASAARLLGDDKRLLVLLLIPVLGIAGGVLYWSVNRAASGINDPLIFEVKRGDFTIKVTERGQIRAQDSMTISAQKDLPIIYMVPEGTSVKKGDLLVRFDPAKYQAGLEESQAALRVTQADQRKAEKDLEANRERLLAEIARFEAEVRIAELDLADLKRKPLPADLENAKMEVEKAKVAFDIAEKRRTILPELVKKGFVTQASYEEAEQGFFKAKADLQAAQYNLTRVAAGATQQELERGSIRLEQTKVGLERARSGMKMQLQSFEADIERQKANVQRAKSLIETARVRLQYTELTAPKDGLVVYATVNSTSSEKIQLGTIPFEGQPLMYLPDLSTMVVDAEVNEIDIGKVTVGSPVEVRPEAYPGIVFHGRVLKIGALAKLKSSASGTAAGVKVFDVTAQIVEKDERLRPGLSAALDIIVERREDAVSIPLSAVVTRGDSHFIYISNDGKIEERKVVLGLSNEHSVFVQEGVREGERVIQSATALGPL